MFISAAPLSASFAGSLAWVITKFGRAGPISPWRLLFLIEGFPSIIAGAIAWEIVPDSPETAKFLTKREKEVALVRLRREKEGAYNETMEELEDKYSVQPRRTGRGLKFNDMLRTLMDPKSYLTAV